MSPLRVLPLLLVAPAAWAGPPVDFHGDPLPPGAVQRFGTVRHRTVGESFQFSADGRSIKAIGWGKYVTVLDARTGLVTAANEMPVDDARAGYFLPGGDRALLVRQPRYEGGQCVWEVWDVNRRALVRRIDAPNLPVAAYGITPTVCPAGRTATFVRYDHDEGMVVVLVGIDLATGKAADLVRLPQPPQVYPMVMPPVFSADGRHVTFGAAVNGTCEVRCWDVGAKKEAWAKTVNLPGQRGQLAALPDGRFLVFDQVEARAFDARTGEAKPIELPQAVRTFMSTYGRSNGGFLPGGIATFVAAQGAKQRLHVWEWEKDRSLAGTEGWDLGRQGRIVATSPDARSVLLTSDPYFYATGELRLIDLTTGKPVWADTRAAGHVGTVDYLQFSPDGRRLASTGDDTTVRAWDVATGRPLGEWLGARAAPYLDQASNSGWMSWITSAGMAWTVDARRLVFPIGGQGPGGVGGAEAPRLRRVDVDTGVSQLSPPLPTGGSSYCGPPVLGPDGHTISLTYGGFAVGPGGIIPTHALVRYSFATDKWTDAGRAPPTPAVRSAVGRTGDTFWADGSKYRTADGQSILPLPGVSRGPLALTRDDRLIAGTAGGTPDPMNGGFGPVPVVLPGGGFGPPTPPERKVAVWDAGSGDVVTTFAWGPMDEPTAPRRGDLKELHWGWPRRLAMHPTGRWLATADVLGVRLWDLAANRVVHRFALPLRPSLHVEFGSSATALAFTPDGSRLATGHPDGTILLWDVPLPGPMCMAAEEADRLWADLMGNDAAAGWRAVWRLGEDPAAAVRLAGGHLAPAEPVPADEVQRLLADVESPRYALRERATRRLETLADVVGPAVSVVLKQTPSEETRMRLKRVHAAAPGPERIMPSWACALGRAVSVVEHAGGDDAWRLLLAWAGGAPDAYLTRAAQAALGRMTGGRP